MLVSSDTLNLWVIDNDNKCSILFIRLFHERNCGFQHKDAQLAQRGGDEPVLSVDHLGTSAGREGQHDRQRAVVHPGTTARHPGQLQVQTIIYRL